MDSVKDYSVITCDDADAGDSSRRSTGMEADPDLAKIIDAWPSLPESLRAGIVAMIDSVRK